MIRLSPFKFIALICLLLSFCAALGAGFYYFRGKQDLQFDDQLQAEYVDLPNEPEEELLALEIDFQSLLARNPDTVGWIYMPGTNINYPVVQTTDNTTYLNKRFDGSATAYGTIFADHRSDLADGNNIILYGHNQGQLNPVKFSQLYNYLTDPDFMAQHPYFEYYDASTGEGTIYDVFAVLRADVTTQINIDNYYQNVPDDKYEWYLNWLQQQTLVESHIVIDPSRRSLLLSTCTDDAKWQRVLVCGLAR